jgi:glycosyltransferase involved in cell wall biosynthesis
MPEPRISILLPVYNGSAFLRQTAESVRAQIFGDWELLIGDNASTDTTPEIVRSLAESLPLRSFRHPRNLGAAGNIQALANEARGEFLCILSHDDLLAPDYLEQLWRAAVERGSALVMSDFMEIDETGKVLPKTHIDGWRAVLFRGAVTCFAAADLLVEIARRKSFPFSVTSLIRAADFRGAGGYDSPYVLACDACFHLRLLLRGGLICFVREKLFSYRRHDQMSSVRDNPRHELEDELHFLFAEHAPVIARRLPAGRAAFVLRQYRSALKRLSLGTLQGQPGMKAHWKNLLNSIAGSVAGKDFYGS